MLLLLTAFSLILPSLSRATTWSTEKGIVTTTGKDEYPSMARLRNNTLVMVWDSNRKDPTGSQYDIYMLRNNGTAWGIPGAVGGELTSGIRPSVAQLTNGSLLVAWSRANATGYDVVYSVFNGTSWSQTQLLVADGSRNLASDLTVTPDGRLWLFWQSNRTDSNYDIYYKNSWNNGGNWTQNYPMPLSTPGIIDRNPSAAAGPDGNILLAWESWISGDADLFLSRFNGTKWSPPLQLTTDPNLDSNPSITVTDDGGIWVFWNSPRLSTSNPQTNDIFMKRCYINCTTSLTYWTPDQRLTVDENQDIQPTAVQSGPGNVGVVWSTNRLKSTSDYDLFYATNTEDPRSIKLLSVQTDLPSVPPGHPLNIQVNSTNQGALNQTLTLRLYANTTLLTSPTQTVNTKQRWTVNYQWNTTGWTPGFYRLRAEIFPSSQNCFFTAGENCQSMGGGTVTVAVRALSIKSPPQLIPSYPGNPIYQGQTISLSANVSNLGQVPETFTMSFYRNGTSIGSATVTSLAPGASTTVYIRWNTTLVPPGACQISVLAPTLPFESNTTDNSATQSYSLSNCVRKTGDVDVVADGAVDITDLILVYLHQFTISPQYDINGDGAVDIVDLVLVFTHMFT